MVCEVRLGHSNQLAFVGKRPGLLSVGRVQRYIFKFKYGRIKKLRLAANNKLRLNCDKITFG